MENHADISRATRPSQSGFAGLIGESAAMNRLYELIVTLLLFSSLEKPGPAKN
jgi:hypothetical protein